MRRPLLMKFLVMSGLILLLMIPIAMIDDLIRERGHFRNAALQDIANSSSHAQTLTGPVLVVPYSKTVRVKRKLAADADYQWVDEQQEGQLYFLPKLYRAAVTLDSEVRRRGIFEALLYHANTRLSGEFEIPAHYGVEDQGKAYQFKPPFLVMGLSDIRGIENSVSFTANDRPLRVQPGTRLERLRDGVHADLGADRVDSATPLRFTVELMLQGTGRLALAPVGAESVVELTSDWPHPRFSGLYLPVERTVDSDGFSARWRTSHYSTNFEQVFRACHSEGRCGDYDERSFGVDFIDPTDRYVKTDRAVKYALLFLVLTFAAFYLFELLKQLRVHPVQYGLIGLALALFYLLLLSLSEHVSFGLAYFGSAAACIALIGFYIVHILRSAPRAAGFSAGLGALYALLYGLLGSEDYALLMGSLLLFVLLAAFMLLTRKLDWYKLGQVEANPAINERTQ